MVLRSAEALEEVNIDNGDASDSWSSTTAVPCVDGALPLSLLHPPRAVQLHSLTTAKAKPSKTKTLMSYHGCSCWTFAQCSFDDAAQSRGFRVSSQSMHHLRG
eukprot:5232-Amphidinium_carterae.2